MFSAFPETGYFFTSPQDVTQNVVSRGMTRRARSARDRRVKCHVTGAKHPCQACNHRNVLKIVSRSARYQRVICQERDSERS